MAGTLSAPRRLNGSWGICAGSLFCQQTSSRRRMTAVSSTNSSGVSVLGPAHGDLRRARRGGLNEWPGVLRDTYTGSSQALLFARPPFPLPHHLKGSSASARCGKWARGAGRRAGAIRERAGQTSTPLGQLGSRIFGHGAPPGSRAVAPSARFNGSIHIVCALGALGVRSVAHSPGRVGTTRTQNPWQLHLHPLVSLARLYTETVNRSPALPPTAP
jgi:hypothetical protein